MEAGQELQLVIFMLAKEEYGLPITKVQEINRMVPITRLPQTPDFMEGVINLRGRVIPVIDLRKRFQLAEAVINDDTRIIIVDIGGQTLGIVVDAVTEVVRLPAGSVEPPPPTFVLDSQYVEGIGKLEDRLLILLAIDKVLTSQEAIALKSLA
ncbi:MAG: chemotaxis protein CheW [Sporomusaceae bacterium]|nr:chemotaxis protein CheW [Sporomusaceae bacterium]